MDKPKSYQEAWDAFETNQLILKELEKEVEACRIDAQRYRKVRAWMQENGIDDYSADPLSHMVDKDFDAAVDALPEPEKS